MNSGNNYSNFNALIVKKTESTLHRFNQIITSDVNNPKLLAALKDIKKYWQDLNRPCLTIFSCKAVGGDGESAENAALMFTLASCGFGIHDDIIDKSANKHLRKTILGQHGPDTALLVGDLLFFKGWTMAHELLRKISDPIRIADVLKVYGHLSIEVCEAELMETSCRRQVDTDVEYFKGILWKAMAETEACCKIGAMLGNGQPSEVEALAEFGRRIGFMSRLADEVEDCLNLKADLSHRIQFESVPLPLLYAAKDPKFYKKIRAIVKKRTISPLDVETLLEICFKSEAFEYVRSIAEENKATASLRLSCLRNSEAIDVLQYLLNNAYKRIDSLCI